MAKSVTVSAEPGWLRELRRSAAERAEAMSWPTPQEEEWRRTDISTVDFASYSAPAAGQGAEVETGEPPQGFAGVLRFRGGVLTAAALGAELRDKGVHLGSLVGSHNGVGGTVEALLRAGLEKADNRLIVWHYQQLTHGALLRVPKFVEVKEPFLIELEEKGDGALSMPHVTVVMEEGARATVASRIFSGESDRLLCNAAVEIIVGDSARLAYFEEQSLSGASTFFSHGSATVGRDAELLHFAAALGSRLVKSRFDCILDGVGSHVNLNGIYFAAAKQHMDLRTVQHHRGGSSYSRSFYKGAVKDQARTVYQGLIEVMPTAPKTDAYLTNRNLVLNDGARADSIPGLRINQDDVRCSHGSTTGKLDPMQVFYLETRGLSRREANQMLVTAYFQELVDEMPEFMRDPILAVLQQRA